MDRRTPAERFPDALAATNRANDELIEGRGGPIRDCFSHREDAALFGGFGGHEVGWAQIGPRLEWVAQSFAGGTCTYETITSAAGSELAFVVQFERGEARIRGRPTPLPLDFRVTMVFRWEDGAWKLLHRHADHLRDTPNPS
ncbi:MAG: YybH family protein [Candidatus Rokuibacteriota bacterium]